MTTAEEIKKRKIIAIIRGIDSSKIVNVAEALITGGISMMEITYDHTKPEGVRNTLISLETLQSVFGTKLLLGAGTVLSVKEVNDAKKKGATYIISPNVNIDVIKETKKNNMISMPGALTPSEIETAYEAGADIVKVFPAASFGPEYIKAIRAPMGYISIAAVGGISEENILDYAKAGCCCFGIGSSLVDAKIVNEGDLEVIEKRAKGIVKILSNLGRY